jgi:hypothetical protein
MSIGPAGFYSIIAATSPQASALAIPLAQTQGSDADLAARDVAEQSRQTDTETKAETAAGVGQTDGEEHTSNERDADGRRLWERPLGKAENAEPEEEQAAEVSEEDAFGTEHKSKDASGESGGQLDLMG